MSEKGMDTMTQTNTPEPAAGAVEEVEIQGHIIDSLLLPKVLDEILTRGGSFVIKEIKVDLRGVGQLLALLAWLLIH